MKTAKITLDSIKDHGWWDLLIGLGLIVVNGEDESSEPVSKEIGDKIKRHFKYGEYASIEIEVDADLNIIGGKILPIEQ